MILPKVLHILELLFNNKEVEVFDLSKPAGSSRAFSKVGLVPLVIPFPTVFDNVVTPEWEAPARPKSNHPIISKFYTLVSEAAERFKLPLVDDAVDSLCSNSVCLWRKISSPGTPLTKGLNTPCERNLRLPQPL